MSYRICRVTFLSTVEVADEDPLDQIIIIYSVFCVPFVSSLSLLQMCQSCLSCALRNQGGVLQLAFKGIKPDPSLSTLNASLVGEATIIGKRSEQDE